MKSSPRKIRYGILGFGLFAERAIAPAIRASSNSELIAIQKRSLSAAEEKAKALGIPLSFDSVEKLAAHEDVDAVYIVSANAFHCPSTIAAARAKKHVLVEKPMALNAAEARKMIAACKQHGVTLMVGHMLRLSPLVRRMRDIVQSGMIGDITEARADFVYDGRTSHRSWLFDRKLAGGGPVYDIGVHGLDTLRFILNDEVVSTKSDLHPRPTVKKNGRERKHHSKILPRNARIDLLLVYGSAAKNVYRVHRNERNYFGLRVHAKQHDNLSPCHDGEGWKRTTGFDRGDCSPEFIYRAGFPIFCKHHRRHGTVRAREHWVEESNRSRRCDAGTITNRQNAKAKKEMESLKDKNVKRLLRLPTKNVGILAMTMLLFLR